MSGCRGIRPPPRGARQPLSSERAPTYREGMDERSAEDRPVEQDHPLGGDETTEEQLDADNPAEEDTLKTLDPDAPPA